jgi:hypothetical protein
LFSSSDVIVGLRLLTRHVSKLTNGILLRDVAFADRFSCYACPLVLLGPGQVRELSRASSSFESRNDLAVVGKMSLEAGPKHPG